MQKQFGLPRPVRIEEQLRQVIEILYDLRVVLSHTAPSNFLFAFHKQSGLISPPGGPKQKR